MKQQIPDTDIVTVKLSKDMTFGEYSRLLEKPMKGWSIKCYQKGFCE